jgi:NADPH:quinone reductase-like Zn-dependent oxidoreductase
VPASSRRLACHVGKRAAIRVENAFAPNHGGQIPHLGAIASGILESRKTGKTLAKAISVRLASFCSIEDLASAGSSDQYHHMKRLNAPALIAVLIFTAKVLGGTPEPSNPKMRAVVIHGYGGPEVMKIEQVSRPEPAGDEVLFRVIAASINPVDVAIRKGYLQKLVDGFPIILGMDAAGIVEKVGNKVFKYKPGDPVFAFFTLRDEGGYAEFVRVKEDELALKPATVSFEQAAGAGAAGATAWEALVDTANLQAGQSVLIHGGSGGVGHMAIQIAKARGAKVFATASTANQDFLRQMGADVPIDYTRSKFEDIAKDVDVVLDTVGRDTLERSYDVVKKGGIVVSIVDEPQPAALEAHGIRGVMLRCTPKAGVLEGLSELMEAKKLSPAVSQTFPMTQVVQAQNQIATGHTRGKIVLQIADGLAR